MKPLRLRIIQTDTGTDPQRALRAIERRLGPPGTTDLVALPEGFARRGDPERLRREAEPIPGPTTARLAEWAHRRGIWILGGSLPERRGRRVFNTSVLFDRRGRRVALYRKRHLFTACLEDGTRIRERALYTPGVRGAMVAIEGWRCGLSICFDLRFPEDFRRYARAGAQVLLVPSDFTRATGKDHWHTLLRARAIENLCFVVAPNQCGRNRDTGTHAYGHSLAVAPWGEILAEAGTRAGRLDVILDPGLLAETRRRLPPDRVRS